MIKNSIIIFLTLSFLVFPSVPDNMQSIRELFYLAVEDEEALIQLEEIIISGYGTTSAEYPPVVLAYAGGLEALKAKHAFSPFAKFSHLMNALDILDESVTKLPEDLEVRFLRFSVLDNIPSFFGYGEERSSDMNEIIKQLLKNDFSIVDKKTQKGIIDYLLDSGRLSAQQEAKLKIKCTAYTE